MVVNVIASKLTERTVFGLQGENKLFNEGTEVNEQLSSAWNLVSRIV